jgi:thioredoxin
MSVSDSDVKAVTEKTFSDIVLASKTPVVVDFWAPWCVWCKKLAPVYTELAPLMKRELTFVTVNVDEERHLSEHYGISSLPTLKFFCEGREIGEMVGALPKDQLQAKFREVIGTNQACLASSSAVPSAEVSAKLA